MVFLILALDIQAEDDINLREALYRLFGEIIPYFYVSATQREKLY